VGIYPTIYQGLRAGWLSVDDLGPLAGVQVWVRVARPCELHPEPGAPCRDLAVHEFGSDGTGTLYRLCDPEGPAPEVTGEVAAVRVLWADGHAERLGPEQEAYLHPVVARLQPQARP
jgi:hypothetical protein